MHIKIVNDNGLINSTKVFDQEGDEIQWINKVELSPIDAKDREGIIKCTLHFDIVRLEMEKVNAQIHPDNLKTITKILNDFGYDVVEREQ